MNRANRGGPDRNGGGRSGPRPVQQGVDRLLVHLRAPRRDTVADVFNRWDDLVGPGLAAHTEPLAIRDGCLVVAVDDTAWASQLEWAQQDLLAALRTELGDDSLVRLEARVRDVS